MNNVKRKKIAVMLERLGNIKEALETLREEEEENFYNLPESLQETERGEKMQEVISILDDACYSLEEICSNLEEV